MSFWHHREGRWTRVVVLPWHAFIGLYTYGLVTATAETGLLEKPTCPQVKSRLRRCSPESTSVNALGIVLAFLCGLAVFTAIFPEGSSTTRHHVIHNIKDKIDEQDCYVHPHYGNHINGKWRIDDTLGQFRRASQSRLSFEDLCPELLDHYGTILPTEKQHSYKATLPDAPKIEPSSCLKRKRKTSTEEVDFGHIISAFPKKTFPGCVGVWFADQRIEDVLGRFRRAFQCILHSKTLRPELDEYEHPPVVIDVSGTSEREYMLAESSIKGTELKHAADHLKEASDEAEISENIHPF